MKSTTWQLEAFLLAGTLASTAGLAHGQGMPRAAARDSAGVRILEYATIKTPLPAFRVSPQLLADVGGLRDDPNDEIEAKTGYEAATRFPDGRVAVVENYTVRILDAKGKFVRLLGGRGGGPGEFDSQITALCRIRGDSLLVRGSRRVSLYDASGTHVRSTVTDGYIDGNCDADGSVVARAPSPAPLARTAPDELATGQMYVVLKNLTRDGRFADSIGVFEGEVGRAFAKAVEDRFSVGVHRDKLYADNGARSEVKVYSRSGKLTSIIRWHDPLIPITTQMLNEFANSRIPTNVSADERATRVAQLTSGKQRASLPAYSGFFVDHAGRLWVRDYWRTAKGLTFNPGYVVFATDGTLLGRYELPQMAGARRATVTDADADNVVIRFFSADEGVRVIVQSIAPAR